MIQFIRDLFSANYEIIYFIYGLVFFVLGLAIALQSRYSSHLELARSLNWLAAFGFLHGFHEWGDLFIPLQASYLAPALIRLLQYLQLILLAISFACLYGFGLSLLEPLKHRRWLHIGFATLGLAWLFLSLIAFRSWFPQFNVWFNSVSALARYLIALPSGLLASYALREHTLKRIASYNVPRIERALKLSGVTMAAYALAAGLIVPPVPFFPGNWLNTTSFTANLLVPPQLFRAVIGLAMALTTIRFLEIFDVETSRRIEAMEQEQILSAERERLARELHDGAIQKVYTAGLLVRSAQKIAEPETPLSGRLSIAVGVLDDAIRDLRQNLVQLHSPATSSASLSQAIQKLATDPRFSALVDVRLNLTLPDDYVLSPERTINVLAILQEALTNVIRHSRARHVWVSADHIDDHLRMQVSDDGIGLPEQFAGENGLRNMRDRAALLHGQLQVERLERGTSVILEIPREE